MVYIIWFNLSAAEVFFSSKYWGLAKYKDKFNGEGVLVAVLDTGVDDNHDCLKGSWSELSSIRYCRNFMGDPDNHRDTSLACHGTAVAGIVAGTHRLTPDKQVRLRYRGFGVEGVPLGVAPKAKLVICKVSSDQPSEKAIVRALRWIYDHNTVVMRERGYQHIETNHKTECGI